MVRNQRDENVIITAGRLEIDDAQFAANASNTVTISSVAPAAVGTATISKWLSFRDNAGTVYYIPSWT